MQAGLPLPGLSITSPFPPPSMVDPLAPDFQSEIESQRAFLRQNYHKERGWKQVEAAAQLGIDQAKVSKLLGGQMAGFSIERLVHFLSLLGQDVEVTVRKAPRGRRRGTVRARVSGRDKVLA